MKPSHTKACKVHRFTTIIVTLVDYWFRRSDHQLILICQNYKETKTKSLTCMQILYPFGTRYIYVLYIYSINYVAYIIWLSWPIHINCFENAHWSILIEHTSRFQTELSNLLDVTGWSGCEQQIFLCVKIREWPLRWFAKYWLIDWLILEQYRSLYIQTHTFSMYLNQYESIVLSSEQL